MLELSICNCVHRETILVMTVEWLSNSIAQVIMVAVTADESYIYPTMIVFMQVVLFRCFVCISLNKSRYRVYHISSTQ